MSAIVVLSEVLFMKCALDPSILPEDAKIIFRELVICHAMFCFWTPTCLHSGINDVCMYMSYSLLSQVNEHIFANEDSEASISIGVLTNLSTFCMENFIRHISLYQMVFSENQKEYHDSKYIAVQTPMLLPSLMEASHYNGEEIGLDTARTDEYETEGGTARSEYEQDDTARTDYTDYTEGD